MEKVTELSLTHPGNSLQTGKRECFTVFLKKTGHVVKKFIVNLFEILPNFFIIGSHFRIGLMKVFDSFFNCFSLSQTTI